MTLTWSNENVYQELLRIHPGFLGWMPSNHYISYSTCVSLCLVIVTAILKGVLLITKGKTKALLLNKSNSSLWHSYHSRG